MLKSASTRLPLPNALFIQSLVLAAPAPISKRFLVVTYAAAFWFCAVSSRPAEAPATSRSTRAAVVLLIVYAAGFSLIAIDLIMSLEPTWSSTLFPAYLFVGNVYAGIAIASVAVVIGTEPPASGPSERRDRDSPPRLLLPRRR